LLALAQVIAHGAVITAYMSLVLIGIFLAAAQGFSGLGAKGVLNAICVAGLLLSLWVLLQAADILPRFSLGESGAGPFNKNAASVFLALCMIAFFRGPIWPGRGWFATRYPSKPVCWWHLLPLIVIGLATCRSTTGVMAALASIIVLVPLSRMRRRMIAAISIVTVLFSAWFFIKVDPLQGTITNDRWQAWKHVAWSFRSEALGRGLKSFAEEFPLMVSGDPRLARQYWAHAHNEYLQTGFEMGVPAMILIAAYPVWVVIAAWQRRKTLSREGRLAAAGIAALAVSCMGWHVFHIPPLALAGCAWLGIGRKEISQEGLMIVDC